MRKNRHPLFTIFTAWAFAIGAIVGVVYWTDNQDEENILKGKSFFIDQTQGINDFNSVDSNGNNYISINNEKLVSKGEVAKYTKGQEISIYDEVNGHNTTILQDTYEFPKEDVYVSDYVYDQNATQNEIQVYENIETTNTVPNGSKYKVNFHFHKLNYNYGLISKDLKNVFSITGIGKKSLMENSIPTDLTDEHDAIQNWFVLSISTRKPTRFLFEMNKSTFAVDGVVSWVYFVQNTYNYHYDEQNNKIEDRKTKFWSLKLQKLNFFEDSVDLDNTGTIYIDSQVGYDSSKSTVEPRFDIFKFVPNYFSYSDSIISNITTAKTRIETEFRPYELANIDVFDKIK